MGQSFTMLSTTVVMDSAAMARYRTMYVPECTKRFAMFFAISSRVIEYIERVGLQCQGTRTLLSVYELTRPRRGKGTYVVEAALVRYSSSPASRSASRWSSEEIMSPRTRDSDTPRRRRLAIVLGVCLPTPRYECQQTQTALLPLSPPAATRSCSRSLTPVSDLYLFIFASFVNSEDGWR